jgi:hypothetical protein
VSKTLKAKRETVDDTLYESETGNFETGKRNSEIICIRFYISMSRV